MTNWVDITKKVKSKLRFINGHVLVSLYDGSTEFGISDLRGVSFMSGCASSYKLLEDYESGSSHDYGGKITWFKVYKRKEVQPLKRDSKGRFC